MSTGHVVVPEIISRLVGQTVDGLNGVIFHTKVGADGRSTVVDLSQITAVQKNLADGAVLFLPGGNWLPIQEDYSQFVEFWAVWKRARQ